MLDFSDTVYIDSTVLSVLIRQKRRAGAHLRIVVPPASRLRRIFEVTGLLARLDIKASIEEARAQPV